MKSSIGIITILALFIFSCTKKDRWDVDASTQEVKLGYTDLSSAFFNVNNSLSELQKQYPFFFDNNTPNEVWEEQRRDVNELQVYSEVKNQFKNDSLQLQLTQMYKYYKYYFPEEITPHTFVYSSGLQNIYEPVLYSAKDGMVFIALDAFLGDKNKMYDSLRVYPYLRKNMNKNNALPAVVNAIGREIVPYNPRQQQFIEQMIYEGKKLILADALLPQTTNALKIGYTQKQIDWCKANEGDIWNYFVEQNLVFESDKSLNERFIKKAPFSKFLNEVEKESPGRIGVWVGWQICKKYLEENPNITLQEFIKDTDLQKIFKDSKYKPKKGDREYTPTKENNYNEIEKYESSDEKNTN